VTLYVLDTDHISLQQRAHPALLQRLQALGDDDNVAVTVITVEEQLRGRLELIRRHGAAQLQVAAYQALQQTLRYFATWQVLDFTQAAFERYAALRYQRIRVGSQDLRIAAITLSNAGILVTRNNRDFAQVPGLVIENWSTM
jgi:tRNA(fMet)-specific endonuclease VapC